MIRYGLTLCLALSLTACSDPYSEEAKVQRQKLWDEQDAKMQKDIVDKINTGQLKEVRYYPQPDLTEGRWFKVEDQVGCRWWINSGHKFDKQFIVLKTDGTPDCDNPKVAPLQNRRLVDKNGNDYQP